MVEEAQIVVHEVTSQIFSLTSLMPLMPTFCPANTMLRLILRRPMQIRPQFVTVMVRSWKGYSRSSKPRCASRERINECVRARAMSEGFAPALLMSCFA